MHSMYRLGIGCSIWNIECWQVQALTSNDGSSLSSFHAAFVVKDVVKMPVPSASVLSKFASTAPNIAKRCQSVELGRSRQCKVR